MQVKIDFNSSLSSIVGIGPTYLKKLDTIGLKTVRDLLFYFPFRYEDLSNEQKIINLEKGSVVNIVATVWQITKFRTKTGKILVKAVINDSTGSLECVWFNQNYLLSVLKPNQVVSFSGKVDVFNNKLTLVNPKFEHIKKGFELVHTKGLVPVYSESGGISARWLRSKIFHLISLLGKDFPETLPSKLLIEEKLVSLGEALKQIHFPKSNESLVESRERLSFEELFFLQLRNLQSKKEQFKDQKAPIIKLENVDKFYKLLSFELTVSQKKAIEEILSDLSKTQPMNRLLQGEVGSGKTIVSAAALFATAENGFQAAFMAPTEILAKQHFENLKSLLGQKYSVELAVAGSKISEKKFDIVVGTHALLQKNIEFKNLALVVVDEQQRFGVSQRKILREKGRNVHYLTMTATPIPRTLALTMNGDLKISTLEEFPFGKKKIRTYLVPSYKRPKAYEFIRKKVLEGAQVFLVCPLINNTESLESVKSATLEFDRLQTEVFSDLKLGLLHGKQPKKERDETLSSFREGRLDLLVATPVVEVGIDIPKASIIVIEAAERFGLSSLHQLRGRVGRAGQEGFCLLFSETNSERALTRLKLLEKYNDGFELAELDLKMRGPGDLFGTLQHGNVELKTADFFNLEMLSKAKKAASNMFERGQSEELFSTMKSWFPEAPITTKD